LACDRVHKTFEHVWKAWRLESAELFDQSSKALVSKGQPIELAEIDSKTQHASQHRRHCVLRLPVDVLAGQSDSQPGALRGTGLRYQNFERFFMNHHDSSVVGAIPSIDDIACTPTQSPNGKIKPKRRRWTQHETQ
jgi:hypothetical protein